MTTTILIARRVASISTSRMPTTSIMMPFVEIISPFSWSHIISIISFIQSLLLDPHQGESIFKDNFVFNIKAAKSIVQRVPLLQNFVNFSLIFYLFFKTMDEVGNGFRWWSRRLPINAMNDFFIG